MTITHINPGTLHQNRAFSQATLAEGTRTLYIGGQNGADASGAVEGGPAEQTKQAMKNVLAILEDVGAGPEDVARMTVYLVGPADPGAAFAAAAGEVWGPHPTAITVVTVQGLARPEALVEIDAVAVL